MSHQLISQTDKVSFCRIFSHKCFAYERQFAKLLLFCLYFTQEEQRDGCNSNCSSNSKQSLSIKTVRETTFLKEGVDTLALNDINTKMKYTCPVIFNQWQHEG